jgi:hypothetical protein
LKKCPTRAHGERGLDTILAICIFAVAIYFIYTTKSKKSKFVGLNGEIKYGKRKGKKGARKAKKGLGKGKKLNKHEEECRRIFQELFQTKFPSVRPAWLKNPATGKNLELDGFCEHYATPKGRGLGFEYDGAQHSQYNSHFHNGNPDEFIYQVKKDDWKTMKCKERGVVLIRIPHFVAYHDLRRYIISELKRQNIPITQGGYGVGGNIYS